MSPRTRTRPIALLAAAGMAAATLAAAPATAGDDPLYAQQWGPQQVNAPAAWATTTGGGATIAIVDSGIDLEHEDLAANIRGGNTFLDCGARGCGNGDWEDGHPHGTHVAGIAGAVAGNGVGIAGVAPDADLLAVRVLDDDGSGSFEDIAHGIRWAANQGADVINLSLGGLPGVQALELTGLITDATEAIDYARGAGAVVVIAAGNEAFPLCASPSFNDGALCVTATDRREARAGYSNEPLKPDLLALSAPGGSALPICGEDILSTVPAGEGYEFCGYASNYDEYAGTSMAAPHVAGVAGLLAGLGCTGAQIEELLLTTARNPLTGLRGAYDPVYGYGIVDAGAAVAAAACVDTAVDTKPTKGNNGKGNGKGKGDDGRP